MKHNKINCLYQYFPILIYVLSQPTGRITAHGKMRTGFCQAVLELFNHSCSKVPTVLSAVV